MNDTYLKGCDRVTDSLCPIFRLGDMVREAGENFHEMAVEVRSSRKHLYPDLLCFFTFKNLESVFDSVLFSSVPGKTTGGRHWHSDQVGLQPGSVDAPLSSQIFLQTAG